MLIKIAPDYTHLTGVKKVDRRFYRRRYNNAKQALAQFAETARRETNLDVLTQKLIHGVDETIQPKRVNVWLRSTSLTQILSSIERTVDEIC